MLRLITSLVGSYGVLNIHIIIYIKGPHSPFLHLQVLEIIRGWECCIKTTSSLSGVGLGHDCS